MADIQQVPLVVPAARQQVHTCSDACLDAVNPATVPQRSPFRYPGGEGSLSDRAFSTLLRNRISRGGIIAPGAGVLRNGENGKGLSSRWYPDTIRRRILDIIGIRDQITFMEGDGISAMEALGPESNAVWFIDPPYTVAGKRLYTHSSIDHEYLFQVAGRLAGDFVLTYDESDEVKALAARSGFETRRIRMKNTHHIQKYELVIGRSLNWLDP